MDELKKIEVVLASLSADETARMIADAREKEYRDQMSREQGAQAKGRAGGRAEEKLEMARKLFRLGVARDIIAQSSGLSESELRNLEQ